MTVADDRTPGGVAPGSAGRDPGLPAVIIDLSGRNRRPAEPAAEASTTPGLVPLAVSAHEPIGMPPPVPAGRVPTDGAVPQPPPPPEPAEPAADPPRVPAPEPATEPATEPIGRVDSATEPILHAVEPPTEAIVRAGDPATEPIALAPAAATVGLITTAARTADLSAGIGSRARGRARVRPRRRRPDANVAGHRRRWRRSSLRMWEAAAWIAAIGVVAAMAGFVIRSVPRDAPFVSGAVPTVPVATIAPANQSCFLRDCPKTYAPGPPTRITIPTIGVDSPLESLKEDGDQVLIPPVRYDEAGWFAKGAVPGDIGPAVIAGHVDSAQGPGVFFKLYAVKVGAAISVKRGGAWVTFRVFKVSKYPKDEFPTKLVYGPTPDAELRVITCGGDFDPVHKRYYDNIVVYAVLAT